MSQIIKNILSRSNLNRPFNDGHKIALVLPGGTMSGIIGIGATIALEELGLSQSFDIIYTASAGFPNASWLVSKNTKLGASIYYEELKDRNFINFFKIWKPVDVEKIIETMKITKPIDYNKLWQSQTSIFVKLNQLFNKTCYIKINDLPQSEYFNVLRSAISFPILSRGGKIKNETYFDGHTRIKDNKDFLLNAINSDCTDILIIYNRKKQRIKDFSKLFPNRVFEIFPDKEISRFETNGDTLKFACYEMKNKVLKIFRAN